MTKVIDINKNDTLNITSINKNSFRFTYRSPSVTTDRTYIKHIDLPESLRDISLFIAFVNYSNTTRFLKLAPGTQVHYSNTFKKLIIFFIENKQLLTNKDDRALSVHYLDYLKNSLRQSRDSIHREFINIKTILTAVTDRFSELFNEGSHDAFLDALKSQLPDIKRIESTPKRVFTDVFNVDHTDEDILISMRHVLTWFMSLMQNIRKDFLAKNRELALDLFNIFDDGAEPFQNRVMKMSGQQINHQQRVMANGYYLRALLKLKNPVLNEMLLLAGRNHNRRYEDGDRYSIWQVRRELEALFTTQENQKRVMKDIDRTDYILSRYHSPLQNKKINTFNQSVLPIGCMFTSTLSERRAIAWLFASERIQATGQDGIKLDDVMLDRIDSFGVAEQIQFKFPKTRAARTFTTPIYKRGHDELFDIYYNFYQLRVNEGKYFTKQERVGYLLPSKWNKLFQRPASLCQTSHLPLLLLGMDGSEMQKKWFFLNLSG